LVQALGGGWNSSELPKRPECCGKLTTSSKWFFTLRLIGGRAPLARSPRAPKSRRGPASGTIRNAKWFHRTYASEWSASRDLI